MLSRSNDGLNVAGVVIEDHYRLERLKLETGGFLQLEVVSTDPLCYPISAFSLPHEDKYLPDSYVIEVKVSDGKFYSFIIIIIIIIIEFFKVA